MIGSFSSEVIEHQESTIAVGTLFPFLPSDRLTQVSIPYANHGA